MPPAPDPASFRHGSAPAPTFRLIASRFPPVGVFDDVATATDLEAVLALEARTNDRLVAERLRRLPTQDRVFGIPNASVVMAAFLHAAPDGARFSNAVLGAWYSAASETTAIAEIAHHLRREAIARGLPEQRRTFRCYRAIVVGDTYLDLQADAGGTAAAALLDPTTYAVSQRFGEAVRSAGGDGIVWNSVRHQGGTCLVAYRPRQVTAVTQTVHYDVIAPVRGRIVARTLTTT